MASLVKEQDLFVPALRLAAARPNGFISTSDLIAELTDLFNPSGQDAEILEGRQDTHFSQKVRNLISHRDSTTSFIKKDYARYINASAIADRGIQITDRGRQLLAELGEAE